MSFRPPSHAALLLVAAIMGCSTEPLPSADDISIEPGKVTAVRVAGGVKISNGSATPLGYLVTNRNGTALATPCIDPGPTCLRLLPATSVVVSDDEIVGSATNMKEAVVLTWTVTKNSAGENQMTEMVERTVKM